MMERSDQDLNTIEPLIPSLPRDEFAPPWFAAYTLPNHEKSVARQLGDRAIPHYLPLYESVRQWKDRKMRLNMPLFPGYVFVRLPLQNRLRVIQVPSVIRLVGFGGEPAAIPEAELAAIRTCLDHNCRMEPHPLLQTGQRVRITRGPLTGIEGILLRRKGISRLVLSVGLIMRAVAVEVNIADIEPIRLPAAKALPAPQASAQTGPALASW
jgi:transcription antitermination factor NusG